MPSYVIEPHKMAKLLSDIHKSESAMDMNRREYRNDTSKVALQEAVFREYKIDKATFDTSLYWYGHHVEEYTKVYDEVIDILQKEIDHTDAVASKVAITAIGDSVDTWSLSPRFILDKNHSINELKFELLRDENWEKGDNYTLNLKAFNILSPIKTIIVAEYENGSLEWIENAITENNKYQFVIITDSTKQLERIFGTIKFSIQPEEVVFIDSISLMRTRVNKLNYSKRYSQKKINPIITVDSLKSKL